MTELQTLLALLDDPPCARCKARREVHNTDELFSRHDYEQPTPQWVRDWFLEVSAARTPPAEPDHE